MTSIQSGVRVVGTMLLLAAAMSGSAFAQAAGPQPGLFVSGGVALDAVATAADSTPAVIGSVSAGQSGASLGLRITLDVPTLDTSGRRRGMDWSFIADGHTQVSPAVQLGFLAGGTLGGAGIGITVGPEVVIAVPGHDFVIVPDVRLTLFPIIAGMQGPWIIRPGVSIRSRF